MSAASLDRLAGRSFADVMVVGGGISGIQAALDLATAGFRVYLVERAPTIGGKMAQLDKTFPTNDCSMCIESPKFIECDRHPNIEILTYTEVETVEGAGRRLHGHPDQEGALRRRGQVHRLHHLRRVLPGPDPGSLQPGAVAPTRPSTSTSRRPCRWCPTSMSSCLFLKDEKCSICEGVCKNEGDRPPPEAGEARAQGRARSSSSPGYEVFDPRLRGDYGYGEIENVVTSLDFERLLCATGPHEGEILRPSDKKHPHKIAWIHCVGSRQVLEGGHSYCSSVCCSYIQKQVILAKDHDADTEATIFHNDIRSYGKDFERFYQRAAQPPRGRRSSAATCRSDARSPRPKNVTIRYATDADGVKEEEFDLVVLGVGLAPPTGARGPGATVRHRAQRPWLLQDRSRPTPSRPPARGSSSAAPSRARWTSPSRW